MKNKCICILMCILFVATSTKDYRGEVNNLNSTNDDLQLQAISAVLIDGNNGRMLYGKNPFDKRAMASTTKIMTCILALEKGNGEDIVEVSKYASTMPKVRYGVSKGEKYKLNDLLYGLMLESFNDLAVVIAEHIGGSVEGFANMMNKKAREIGMSNTNFVTPNGLDAKNHYSSAYDMALLGAYAIKNKEFISITNTKSFLLSEIDGKKQRMCSNKDLFLDMMPGAVGIKTGFTGEAGYCFIGAVVKEGKTLISSVLASGWPPSKQLKWRDTKSLMKYGMENFEYKTLLKKRSIIKKVPVMDGISSEVTYENIESYGMLVSKFDNIKIVTTINENLSAPIYKGEKLGEAKIYVNDKITKKIELVAKEKVSKLKLSDCFERLFTMFKLRFR